MRILMKRADEGEKLVYLDDIEKHRADGWVDADQFVPPDVPAPVAAPVASAVVAHAPEVKEPKKRGPKPKAK